MAIKIPVIEINQPIDKFYIGKIKAHELLKLSSSDIRRIEHGEEETGYSGIQRELDPQRVRSITQFIETVDSTFPNSIILDLANERLVNLGDGFIEVEDNEETFNIIDGQHRLSGFKGTKNSNFDLIITIFIGLKNSQRARIFSKINSTHKPVNKSHSFDLEAESDVEHPKKFVRFIANAFNTTPYSPWYNMIKMTGKKDELSEMGILTQMAFVDPILNYMYPENRFEEIRSEIIKGNKLSDFDKEKYFLWSFFKNNEKKALYKILSNYFVAFKKTFKVQWGNDEYILCKSVGYKAMMLLFKDLYKFGVKDQDLSEEYFSHKLQKCKQHGNKLTSLNYSSSSQGASELYKDLKKLLL